MRRDMDLVRDILIRVDDADGPVDAEDFVADGRDMRVVLYHVQLMEDHGLIDAKLRRTWEQGVIGATIDGLTWDGCDYVDAIRDDRVWVRTKRAVREFAGSTTMAVIKEVAVKMALAAVLSGAGLS